jgi:hypothetical protein
VDVEVRWFVFILSVCCAIMSLVALMQGRARLKIEAENVAALKAIRWQVAEEGERLRSSLALQEERHLAKEAREAKIRIEAAKHEGSEAQMLIDVNRILDVESTGRRLGDSEALKHTDLDTVLRLLRKD